MKLGLKEMKKEYKKVDIGKIEVSVIYNGINELFWVRFLVWNSRGFVRAKHAC